MDGNTVELIQQLTVSPVQYAHVVMISTYDGYCGMQVPQ